MAGKLTKYPLRGLNTKEVVLHVCSFTPDTNTTYPHNVPVSYRTNGAQFTVTKTAAGTYVVKFLDSFTYMVEAQAQTTGPIIPSGAAGAALQVAVGSYVTASNTVTLRLYNPTTALSSGDVTAVEPSSVPAGAMVGMSLAFRLTGSPD